MRTPWEIAQDVLDALEKEIEESPLRGQWPAFSREAEDLELIGRFEGIASLAGVSGQSESEESATRERAYADLMQAVSELVTLSCKPEYVELLDSVTRAVGEFGPGSGGTMLVPDPKAPDIVIIKEIANRYHSLLAKLREVTSEAEEDTDD